MERLPEFIGNHPWLVAAFVLILLLLVGTEVARWMRRFREVSPGQATLLINREKAVVLDVRSAAEFQEGHIAGARHVPLDGLDKHQARIDRWRERPVLVCCDAGNRSPKAAGWLTARGFERVFVLAGGLRAWRADNLPLEKGKK